jgi:NAD(P)-dependent dehydrogenase (short-subunit alcohol dehydrogenase family)
MSEILNNKNIVVIGGNGAIGDNFLGKAIKQGAKCVAIGRHAPKQKIPFFYADITSLDDITSAADNVISLLGNIDILINFSGTHHKPMDITLDVASELLSEYNRVMEVNLKGAFISTIIFGKKMVVQRHGHIIHLCSNASRLALYGSYAYNMSKHGLEGLVKTAAAQFAPYGVRVNGVAPGTVETDLNKKLLRTSNGKNYSSRASSILAHTPTKKFATLDGISETVIATCMPQRHLNGNVIFCDDGYNIEGHSWPEGNAALYGQPGELDDLFSNIDKSSK